MAYLWAKGRRLEYLRVGEQIPGRPTLVFLHEGLGCVSSWRDFPRELARITACPGLLYSRWGFGKSEAAELPRPASFMHEEARQFLPEVLRQCSVEQTILVGHSDGASIALIYAAENGVGVRALILEAPHVFVEEVCLQSIGKMREDYGKTRLRQGLAKHHGDKVDAAFYGWADTWLHPSFRHWNLEEFLPRIHCPLLVVQGENDEYGTLAQVEAICGQVSGPWEKLVLPGCGHVPHRERRREVLLTMARFIRRLPEEL